MNIKALISFAFVLLIGCSTSQSKDSSLDRFQQWSAENWLYAQLAANSYSNTGPERFQLSSNVRAIRRCGNGECHPEPGFAYNVYEILQNGQRIEIVIAFRGTDQILDWPRGNIVRTQNSIAVRTYDSIKEEYYGVPISVVGDSLGGALASQVGICRDVHRRLAINTSPRFSRAFCNLDPNVELSNNLAATYSIEERVARYSLIAQRWEFLRIFRPFFRNERVQTYWSVRCERGDHTGLAHDVTWMAKCITNNAAAVSDEACESIRRNEALFSDTSVRRCLPAASSSV